MIKSARLFIVVLLVVVPIQNSMGQKVLSTFDVDEEGWVGIQGVGITHAASGGNPDGHIIADDLDSGWGYVEAPVAFLTQNSCLFSGSLSFDLRHEAVGDPVAYNVRVAVTGNGLALINESVLPTTAWENYQFSFADKAGWRIASSLSQNYSPNDPAPTAQQFRDALDNIDGLFIATDYTDGTAALGDTDRTSLDNIRLTSASAFDVSVVRGIYSSGTGCDLMTSDNVDYSVFRNPVQATGVIEVQIESTTVIQTPTVFDFTLEASAFFRTPVIQSIEFFDYDTGNFVPIDSTNASRFTDSVFTVTGSGDLSRFVDDATGQIRAKILFESVFRRQAFSAAMDQVFWTISD